MFKTFATHMVKVTGVWNGSEQELCSFVESKLREIDGYFSPETELIKLDGSRAEVWVLISTLIDTQVVKEMAEKWAEKHLTEVEVTGIEVEELGAYRDLRRGRLPRHAILLG